MVPCPAKITRCYTSTLAKHCSMASQPALRMEKSRPVVPPPGGVSLTSACSALAQPACLLHAELLHTLCSSPEVTVLTEKSSFTDSDTVGAVKEASVCIATCMPVLQRCEQPEQTNSCFLLWSPLLWGRQRRPTSVWSPTIVL